MTARMPTGVGHTLRFRIDPLEGTTERRIRLYLDEDDEPVAEDRTRLTFDGPTQLALLAIQAGKASEGQVQTGGLALWERLRVGAIGQALEPLRNQGTLRIRLQLQTADEGLPWEALYDDRRQRLAANNAYTLVRDPDRALPALATRPGPMSLLIVAPGGSKLRVDTEVDAIRTAFEHHGVAVRIAAPLFDRVTVETLRDRLAAKLGADGTPYEIVHFIGHGVAGTDGVPKLVFNDDGSGNHEIPPSSLASLLQGGSAGQAGGPPRDLAPRLVVLNACHSGSAAEARGLAGFGQELLSTGVRAVVAMQRPIRDDVAVDFAVGFYRELARSGRVDAAVTVGRQWLHQNQQPSTATAFSTPVLFQVPGVEPVFEVSAEACTATTARAPVTMPPRPPVAVPEALIDAVLARWCVPVLGPSLSVVSRDRGPAWTPGALAETLAQACRFPELQVVTAMAQLGERLDHMLLQRVCDHFFAKHKRPPLIQAIKAFFAGVGEVPIHDDLATWPVPGFVCSHFDGLLARAFGTRAFRPIYSLDKPAPTAAADGPLIVHLRGSVADAGSMRLTGADHDHLLDAMTRMDAQSSSVAGLVTAYSGTCLLLLGATAWDPWLRHLLWRMVPRDNRQNNTLYIVQRHPTDADKAAWGGFAVEWIDETAEDVVAAITAKVPQVRR